MTSENVRIPEGEPEIFIPQPIPQVATERLESLGDLTVYPHTDHMIPRDELLEAVPGKDVLFAIGEVPFDEEVIEAAEDLKLIAAMHTAATFVDFDAATERNIPVTGISNMIAETTAEFAFALIIGTAWRLPEADRFTRERKWRQNQSEAFLGSRIHGKTLGVVGMGDIGTKVAERAHACGMKIRYNKRTPLPPHEEALLGAEYRELEDLFRESDIISVHAALTEETEGMIGEELFALMDEEDIFINTSRGDIIDERALEDALEAGAIHGAGLDVYWEEVPEAEVPGPSERMTEFPNCVFTPHIGTAARETREEMALETVDAIEAFLDGERPEIVLNPEVYGEAPRDTEVIG